MFINIITAYVKYINEVYILSLIIGNLTYCLPTIQIYNSPNIFKLII